MAEALKAENFPAESKYRIIDEIRQVNPAVAATWLSRFNAQQLRRYLDHLEFMLEPRGRGSRWMRAEGLPPVVVAACDD